jgi:hypothetical protein
MIGSEFDSSISETFARKEIPLIKFQVVNRKAPPNPTFASKSRADNIHDARANVKAIKAPQYDFYIH